MRKEEEGFANAKTTGAEHDARTLTKEHSFPQIPAIAAWCGISVLGTGESWDLDTTRSEHV